MMRIKLGLLVVLFVTCCLALARSVAAHGGGTPQLVNAPLDAMALSAWTQPDPIRVGEMHVTVALSDRDAGPVADGERDGAPVLNQDVRLDLISVAGDVAASVPVTHANAVNKLFYEADFTLPTEGEWEIRLTVNERESVSFRVTALPAATLNWALIGGVGVGLVAVGWFVMQTRAEKGMKMGVAQR